jgi:hypothetical protein
MDTTTRNEFIDKSEFLRSQLDEDNNYDDVVIPHQFSESMIMDYMSNDINDRNFIEQVYMIDMLMLPHVWEIIDPISPSIIDKAREMYPHMDIPIWLGQFDESIAKPGIKNVKIFEDYWKHNKKEMVLGAIKYCNAEIIERFISGNDTSMFEEIGGTILTAVVVNAANMDAIDTLRYMQTKHKRGLSDYYIHKYASPVVYEYYTTEADKQFKPNKELHYIIENTKLFKYICDTYISEIDKDMASNVYFYGYFHKRLDEMEYFHKKYGEHEINLKHSMNLLQGTIKENKYDYFKFYFKNAHKNICKHIHKLIAMYAPKDCYKKYITFINNYNTKIPNNICNHCSNVEILTYYHKKGYKLPTKFTIIDRYRDYECFKYALHHTNKTVPYVYLIKSINTPHMDKLKKYIDCGCNVDGVITAHLSTSTLIRKMAWKYSCTLKDVDFVKVCKHDPVHVLEREFETDDLKPEYMYYAITINKLDMVKTLTKMNCPYDVKIIEDFIKASRCDYTRKQLSKYLIKN